MPGEADRLIGVRSVHKTVDGGLPKTRMSP